MLLFLGMAIACMPIHEEFQQLINEGVQAVGMQTMEGIKNRIREGIVQEVLKGWAWIKNARGGSQRVSYFATSPK